jgi:uncharacterized protein involved in cysteine biosynthesis
MSSAFIAAFKQLNDPPVRRVIWRVALWTGAAFGVLGWGLWSAIGGFDPESSLAFITIDWIREPLVWLAAFVVAVIGGFMFFALFWLLFTVIVQFVSGFYLDRVIAAVEARHYPGLASPESQSLGAMLGASLSFFGALIALNLLALPVYLIPTVGLVAFYVLNGYLLGREYFDMVALRRLDAAAARRLRRAHRGKLLGAGLVITVLLSLPLINLVAPIVGAAAMVHLYARMSDGREVLHAPA